MHRKPDTTALQCEPDQKTATPGAPGNPLRILLVEDNDISQIVAASLLEECNVLLDIVDDGAQAVRQLRQDGAGYDLVLMDVQMPVMDGCTATRLIRGELGLSLPIVAMSAGTLTSEREQCTQAGMDGFIAKPIDGEELMALLQRYRGLTMAEPTAAPSANDGNRLKLDALNMLNQISGVRLRTTLQQVLDRSQHELYDAIGQWQQGDPVAAARLVHRFKGSLGTFACTGFVEQAGRLEQSLQAQDGDVDTQFALFSDALEQVLLQLRAWLAQHPA